MFKDYNNNKPKIVTGQYNSRAGISSLEKSCTRLYFLMSVASEARIEKNKAKFVRGGMVHYILRLVKLKVVFILVILGYVCPSHVLVQ
jgi:hypothetical protein